MPARSQSLKQNKNLSKKENQMCFVPLPLFPMKAAELCRAGSKGLNGGEMTRSHYQLVKSS